MKFYVRLLLLLKYNRTERTYEEIFLGEKVPQKRELLY